MEDQSGVLIQDQPHQRLILVHSSSHHHQQRASNTECHSPCPSPLRRDVGRLFFPRWTDRGRKNPGGTQKVGGPHSASRKRATTKVVARFLCSLVFYPTDPSLPKCQHVQACEEATTKVTWQRHNDTTTTTQAEQRKMNGPTMTTRPQQQE